MKTKHFSISVGLTVYLEPTGNATRSKTPDLIPGTISKIGRKYFYVTSQQHLWGGEAKFDKETFTCYDTENNYGYRIYLKPEWYEQEKDRIEKLAEIKNLLSRAGEDLPCGVVFKIHEVLTNWYENEIEAE